MKIYNQWKSLRDKHKNIVIGLGNFDGVHVGHRELITGLVSEANRIGGTATVFTFHPHPLKVLTGKAPPKLLSQESKQFVFRQLGVEVLLLVPFTLVFASQGPDEFIEKVLVKELDVRAVFVGYNYTFGKGGIGTPDKLIDGGKRYGFSVHVIPPVYLDGLPVSSTLIRNLLADGEVSLAKKFLGGYPYVEGVVTAGEKIGRKMGFPTANLDLKDGLTVPANGVYAVKVQVDGDDYTGVANIGVKPTIHKINPLPKLEVHLLDFQADLYGKLIKVFFNRRIREEKKFASQDELAEQILIDIKKTRDAFTD